MAIRTRRVNRCADMCNAQRPRDTDQRRSKAPHSRQVSAKGGVRKHRFGVALALQGVHDVHGSRRLAVSVLGVGHGITNHVLEEEDLEHTAGLLVDEAGDALHTTTASQAADCGLGDALRMLSRRILRRRLAPLHPIGPPAECPSGYVQYRTGPVGGLYRCPPHLQQLLPSACQPPRLPRPCPLTRSPVAAPASAVPSAAEDAEVYSHGGPIGRRKRRYIFTTDQSVSSPTCTRARSFLPAQKTRRYILTADQSDAGSAGIFSRRTNQCRTLPYAFIRVFLSSAGSIQSETVRCSAWSSTPPKLVRVSHLPSSPRRIACSKTLPHRVVPNSVELHDFSRL
eukprot:1196385-Prorocentrum_minimum.AAC.4